jgi:MarR family
MITPRPSGRPDSPLHAVKGRPLAMTLHRGERRDPVRRAAVVARIAAEFREMPGLILSVKQASRLLGLDEPACERILNELERDGLLRRRRAGTYGCV